VIDIAFLKNVRYTQNLLLFPHSLFPKNRNAIPHKLGKWYQLSSEYVSIKKTRTENGVEKNIDRGDSCLQLSNFSVRFRPAASQSVLA
jgi:hypothetical protein